MKTPKDMQVCYVKMRSREGIDMALWDTDYSLYGAGGHFRFADGSMAGLPVDVEARAGTHWIATATPDTAVEWQEVSAAQPRSAP